MYRTEYHLGRLTSAPTESSVSIHPSTRPSSARPGVLFVHGAGSNSTYCISPMARQSELTRKVAIAGYTGFSHDNGGTSTWGNSTAINRLSAGWDYVHSLRDVKAGPVALISASMGGLNSLNFAAANPSKVSCIVSVIPVIDLSDIYNNNRSGYKAGITAAYGSYSEVTHGQSHNPLTMALSNKYADIPILLFYGLTDSLCLASKTEQFASVVGSNVTLVPLSSGHDWDSYNSVDHDMIVDFLETHAV